MNLNDNLDKLPKWAQKEVKVLQMRLAEKTADLDRILQNPESNTILGSPYVFGNQKIKYLKNNQEVTFVLENGNISCRINRGALHVTGHGDGEIYVKPQVSNALAIHLIKTH